MGVLTRALWLLQLASRPWLRLVAAAVALACCWPQDLQAGLLLLLACFLGAPFGATEQLQELIGFTKLFTQLLAPVVGPVGWLPLIAGVASAALAMAAHHSCLRAMAAARSPTASGSTRLIAFTSYALCTGAYWLPAGQACCAVGAAMLRCPSLAQLPAALLRPAVLWQLFLVLLACERWQDRAFADFGMLRSEFYLEVRRLADAPASDGGRGTAPPFYQSLLDKLDEMAVVPLHPPDAHSPRRCVEALLNVVSVMVSGTGLPSMQGQSMVRSRLRLLEAAWTSASSLGRTLTVLAMDLHSVTTMFASLLAVAVMGGTAAMLRLPAPPTRKPPLSQFKHWLLQPVRAAAVAACRALLRATSQPPSWLPSRETLCMLCLLEGPMRSIGFHGSGAELWPGASWLISAFLAALFQRYLRVSYFALQGFAGILIWVRLIVWHVADGTGLPLPARPLGFAWWAAAATAPFTLFAPFYRGQAAAGRLLERRSQHDVAYLYLACSLAFWGATLYLYLSFGEAMASTLARIAPFKLAPRPLCTHISPLPTIVLLPLCSEPWAYKARFDWRVWQEGIASLPQLLQRMPPEQMWNSRWWPLNLLRACLRGMLSLFGEEEHAPAVRAAQAAEPAGPPGLQDSPVQAGQLPQPNPAAGASSSTATAAAAGSGTVAAGGSRRRRHTCAHCGATRRPDSGRLRMCARCQRARFCSQECMAAAWPTHRSECVAPEDAAD